MAETTEATQRTGKVGCEHRLAAACQVDADLRRHIAEGQRMEIGARIAAMVDDGRAYVVKLLPAVAEPEPALPGEPPLPVWMRDIRIRREALVALFKHDDAEVGECVARLPLPDDPGDLVFLDDGRAFRRVGGLWRRIR